RPAGGRAEGGARVNVVRAGRERAGVIDPIRQARRRSGAVEVAHVHVANGRVEREGVQNLLPHQLADGCAAVCTGAHAVFSRDQVEYTAIDPGRAGAVVAVIDSRRPRSLIVSITRGLKGETRIVDEAATVEIIIFTFPREIGRTECVVSNEVARG